MVGFDLRANRGPPGGRALPGVASAATVFLKMLEVLFEEGAEVNYSRFFLTWISLI